MILLTSTSDQLQFTTSGVQSTDWNCSWNDMNFAASTMVPGSSEGNQAAAATVVLISPPASGDQRQVKFLSIVNRDPTNTQNITVQKVGAAGTFNLTGSYPLQPGWALQYVDSHGFMVLNAAGAIQYVGSVGATGATGAGGPGGPYLILDADQGEEGMMIPGGVGPPGPTGTGVAGPQGVATFLDAEVIDPDLFIVPGPPGAAGGTGSQGPQGVATFLEGEIGPDGDQGPPGITGATGATGPQGTQGPATYLDAEVFEPDVFIVPGSPGASGTTGAQGPLGYGPPGADGDQGDDGFPIPGNQGAQGVQGVQGLPGVAVLLDADQGDDGYSIPGNPGVNGINGAQGPMGSSDLLWLAEIPDDPPPYASLLDNVTLPLDPCSVGRSSVGIITDTTTYTSGGVTLANQIANQGKAWRVKAIGQFIAVSSATARNAQVAVFWGSTQLTAISVAVLASTAQTTQYRLEIDIYATSTTALWVAGNLLNQIGSTTAFALTRLVPASTTVTAGPQTIDLRFSMSVAVATDEWAVDQLTIERIQ